MTIRRRDFRRRTQRQRRGWLELLEDRRTLTTVGFAPHDIVAENETNSPVSTVAADLDADGDVDVLAAFRGDNTIAWYENTDGRGTFGSQQVITSSATAVDVVHVADLDGDDDLDVIFSTRGDTLAWFPNVDGKGMFGPQLTIASPNRVNWIDAVDIDGDMDLDLVTSTWREETVWYENTDGQGSFGEAQVISDLFANNFHSTFATDLDGDGDVDVVATHPGDERIAWFENTDGKGTFGPRQVIGSRGVHLAHATDLDGDGDADVITTYYRDDEIRWYENGGQGSFGQHRVVAKGIGYPWLISAVDVDGDGDMDLLSDGTNSRDEDYLSWYENVDGRGGFGPRQPITTLVANVRWLDHADLDGDGDIDVISASTSDDKLAWYENIDGKGTFGEQNLLTGEPSVTLFARSIFAADIDQDGDVDALSASRTDGKIAWYENTDGNGTFGPQQVILADNGLFPRQVFSADMDNDGDVDVLSASGSEGGISWFENTDGLGTFGPPKVILAENVNWIYVADVDADGDNDIVAADWQRGSSRISWYENVDGSGTFEWHLVGDVPADSSAQSVFATDLDGDGDVDILTAVLDGGLHWYENLDGLGDFGRAQAITSEVRRASSVFAADLDGDGDMDVLSASTGDDKIAWYENTDGQATFGPQQVITTEADGLPQWPLAGGVYADDVDGDGDIDVLSSSTADGKIAWYENTDGLGTFGPQLVITTAANFATSVFAADVDGDGDTDVLSSSGDKISWYEQRIPGDANDDNAFNSSDLVQVFRIGEYEDDVPGNSTFDEGDWNGDGDFTTSDLVFAFQAGGYTAAATPGRSDIAAAIDLIFAEAGGQQKKSTAFVP